VSIWAFDIDGTVIGAIRSYVLRPGTIEIFQAINASGARVVLWSAGGSEYAERMAANHGIIDHVHGFFEKPDRNGAAHYSVDHIPEPLRPTVFVDDSPGDLPPHWDVIAVDPFMGSNPHDRGLDTVRTRLRLA
jgi:hypothetical protein